MLLLMLLLLILHILLMYFSYFFTGIDIDVDHLSLEDIKALVCQLVEKNNQLKKRQQQQRQISNGSRNHPVSVFERSRQVPSYLAKKMMRKRT